MYLFCIVKPKKRSIMNEFLFNGTPIKVWARAIDPHAFKEIDNLSKLPFVYHHLAFMPDVHGGKGMPIGGILATKEVVVPNAVGVDIGCGMCAVKTHVKVDTLTPEIIRNKILSGIRQRIPVGRDHHEERQDEKYMPQGYNLEELSVVKRQYVSATRQIGTLGGGNHFIEIQKDEEGMMWVMIHSGSRNLGKQVGKYYDQMAERLNRMWYTSVDPEWQMNFLPLRTPEFRSYWREMQYCVDFALCNRKLMMERILEVIADVVPDVTFEPMINIAHNYAAWEDHFGESVIVHRKGAIRARVGELGIIPGSQGTKSYIVEGLGNELSFMSSSHGAGRQMSRTEAINTLDLEKEIEFLDKQGIIHDIHSLRNLEEAPSAYKDIDEVMASQADLVKIRTTLLPIAVIKGV